MLAFRAKVSDSSLGPQHLVVRVFALTKYLKAAEH